MLNSFSPAQIERFKREAKKLHRTTGITHSAALDQIAFSNGYGNWSLLMKRHSDLSPEIGQRPAPHRFNRTTEEMRDAVRKLAHLPDGLILASSEAQQHIEHICDKFISAANAIDFSIDYMRCLLALPRFKVHGNSRAYLEMRWWLPYHLSKVEEGGQVLLNRHYKGLGDITHAWADHETVPHLCTHLSEEQLLAVSLRPGSKGYFFDDGCPPWGSRRSAEEYLGRLLTLRDALQ